MDRAAEHGTPGLVIDQPGSIAQLALAVARSRQVPVAYVPGLVMRRAADLYPGEAKTDKRDAYVIADTGRTRRKQVHWLDAGSDELLERLRVLNGFDIDLAADQTRLTNRCRDALTSVSPALERALGARLHQAGVRDLLAKYPTLTALQSSGAGPDHPDGQGPLPPPGGQDRRRGHGRPRRSDGDGAGRERPSGG